MAFPDLRPTSRSAKLGDWPVKTYRAQNGREMRFLYGNRRTGTELELSYENIADSQAGDFLSHFEDVKGTYGTFDIRDETRAGWNRNAAPGSAPPFDPPTGNKYRYADAPQISSVRPGRSTVTVRLVSVLQ